MRETVASSRAAVTGGESERAAAFRRLADSRLYVNYRLANAILGDPTESQDAVHDAVVTAWRRWPTLRDQSKFDAWFSRIVVNTCRNRLQKATRRRTTDIAEQTALAVGDASREVHDREQLARGLAQLKPDDRVVLARFFEEQPRAGLGGVYTHTAQGSGTTAAGEPIIIDLSRARDEDGTVGDDILVDIGEPGSEEAISLRAVGPDGLIQFGETSVAATDVELTDFETDPVMLSFDIACG